MEAAMADLISTVGVLGASAALELLKPRLARLDARVLNAVKPLQPMILALAGVALPMATAALGVEPVDPSVFITAPSATVVAVSLREVALRLQRRK